MLVTPRVRMHIELTSRCRLACTKCIRTGMGKLLKIADIKIEHIEKIAKTESITDITFSGSLGDPIYHPKFLEIVKILKASGKTISVNTNGSGKKIEFWKELYSILDKRDRVVFAIDGFEKTVGMYRKNFTKADFEAVKEAMLLGKSMDIAIVWNFIPFNFNENQIVQAAKWAIQHEVFFTVKKSKRWQMENDPLIPTNRNLVSSEANFLRKKQV